MGEPDKRSVTLEELFVSSLAQTDALAKLLIEKGLISCLQPVSADRPNGMPISPQLFSIDNQMSAAL
jgi:hypothetical protein